MGVKAVVDADAELAKTMTELYEEYVKEMELGKVWNPEIEIGENAMQNRKDYRIASMESADLSNNFELSIDFKKGQVNVPQQTPQGLIQVPQEQVMWKIIGQGWK